MKKILLLLCTVALMACSKDDENIQYDNTKGYLTNLESVKFGIIGRWIWEDIEKPTLFYEFLKNGTTNFLMSVKYEIYEKNEEYWIRFFGEYDGIPPSNNRIEVLNKTYLKIALNYRMLKRLSN